MCCLLKASHTAKSQKMQAGLFFAEANPKLVASSIVAATLLGAGVMNLVDTKSLNADYIRERSSLLSRNESDTKYNAREIAKLQQDLNNFKEKHEGDFREQKQIKEKLATLTVGYSVAHSDLQQIKNKLQSEGRSSASFPTSKRAKKFQESNRAASEESFDPDEDLE